MLNTFATTATNRTSTGQLYTDLIILFIGAVALWRVFVKANEPGWKAIIPFYNIFVLYKIAGKPWYWVLLSLIPIADIYFIGYMFVSLGKSFGKGTTWSIIVLFLLNPIGLLILAFDKSKYFTGLDGTQSTPNVYSTNQQSSQPIQPNNVQPTPIFDSTPVPANSTNLPLQNNQPEVLPVENQSPPNPQQPVN